MSPAAVTQPAARPAEAMSQHAAQRVRPPRRGSDFAIARAAAQAIRMAPGVVDLSPGLFALVATYGSGQRVAGIVVHHLTPDRIAIEAHVVLSEAYCYALWADSVADVEEDGAEGQGILIDSASRIRSAVYKGVRDTTSRALARVDVFIDDLR